MWCSHGCPVASYTVPLFGLLHLLSFTDLEFPVWSSARGCCSNSLSLHYSAVARFILVRSSSKYMCHRLRTICQICYGLLEKNRELSPPETKQLGEQNIWECKARYTYLYRNRLWLMRKSVIYRSYCMFVLQFFWISFVLFFFLIVLFKNSVSTCATVMHTRKEGRLLFVTRQSCSRHIRIRNDK